MLYVNQYEKPLHVWVSDDVDFKRNSPEATDTAFCGISAVDANGLTVGGDETSALLAADNTPNDSLDDLLDNGDLCETCRDEIHRWMTADEETVDEVIA